ncbi:MAG: dephospho-CoA kinase [Deltaproteobacteria bacterium]|nr:MAG: dephospho-CoA kinase [Deltaproteobacteria bacterium]
MIHIGLTGGIATGKSTVAKMFEEKGATLINLDQIAHKAISPGKQAWKKIREIFGDSVLQPDKSINREKLAKIVFQNKEQLKKLEEIIHPEVIKMWQEKIETISREKPKTILISEIPLLFEKKLAYNFDATVLVYAPPQIQISRIMERDGITREEAEKRLAAQLPIDEKVSLATYAIYNDGSLEKTRQQVEQLWDKLVFKLKQKNTR